MPRSPSSLRMSWPIRASSGGPISTCGVAARRERRSGSATCPARRRRVGDDQQRLAPRLGVVPGVEQRLLVMILGIVEQPAAGLADEDPAEQAAAGLARAGDEGRHHRPERPAGQMIEGGAIGLGEEEILLPVGHRPGERERDLVHRQSHGLSARSSTCCRSPPRPASPAPGARPGARRRRRRS